jgi:DNA-binding response OmpR family regulator
MLRVLLVEDDQAIGQAIESSLRLNGYQVRWATTAGQALAEAKDAGFDLVLLDLGLPDRDGVDVCRRLRAFMPQSVLVILTARQDEMDVVVGLEAGADDYLIKPVRLGELLARVRAHLRRGPVGQPTQPVISVGELRVDTAGRRVSIAGQEVTLRAKEFDLLAKLAEQPGVAVSRDTLMTEVWDAHWYGSTKTLDVHIAALRRKLAAGARSPEHAPEISTLRGHGYRLEKPGHRGSR